MTQIGGEHDFGYALRCASRLVGAVIDIEPGAFIGPRKGSPTQVDARQLVVYLLHTEAGFTPTEIAHRLGRHRSTFDHAIEKYTAMREDEELERSLSTLGQMFRDLLEAHERVPALIESLKA